MKSKVAIKLLLISLTFIFVTAIHAETIILKSGQIVEGKIVEKTDEYIKINYYGVDLTYFFDEIEAIDGEKPVFSKANAEAISSRKDTFLSEQNNVVSTSEKCFLWEVKSTQSTVYILGSIHVGRRDMYPLRLKVIDAFNKSDLLVLEIKPKEDPVEAQRIILRYAFFSEGETLQEYLSEEVIELAETKLAEFNISLSSVERYRPWYLSMKLEEIALQRLGYFPLYGIDYYFFKRAEDSGKSVLELESIEYQANIFNSLSKAEQELMLYTTLVGLDHLRGNTNKLIEVWLKGDIETMKFLAVDSDLLADPRLLPIQKKIIYERNKNMAARIEEFLKTGMTYFIIVGTRHLIGERSIIELLKDKGYAIREL